MKVETRRGFLGSPANVDRRKMFVRTIVDDQANNRTDKHLTAINIRRATQETTARLDLHSIAVTT
jgi:hypothetical protein